MAKFKLVYPQVGLAGLEGNCDRRSGIYCYRGLDDDIGKPRPLNEPYPQIIRQAPVTRSGGDK